jgi:hypothetical protein
VASTSGRPRSPRTKLRNRSRKENTIACINYRAICERAAEPQGGSERRVQAHNWPDCELTRFSRARGFPRSEVLAASILFDQWEISEPLARPWPSLLSQVVVDQDRLSCQCLASARRKRTYRDRVGVQHKDSQPPIAL